MRRRLAALAMLVAALSGCGEDEQQEAAREEVQAHAATLSGYDARDAHCTKGAGVWFGRRETSSFLCAVRRDSGGCDWFSVAVDRERRAVDVRLRERDAGCVLPA